MKQLELSVQIRTNTGKQKMKELRDQGVIPAVIYGEAKEPSPIQVLRRDFDRAIRQNDGSTSGIFHIQLVEGEKKGADLMALVKDVQYHPVSDMITHVDFLRISMDKEISTRVPVVLKGEAIGLKKPGATLEHMIRNLEILCLPKNIPQQIDVDITNLDTHHSIHVSDLKLGEGVRTKMDPGAAVAAVVFSTREDAPAAAGADAAKPELEVIKEKPKDEKAAGGDAKAAAPAAKAPAAKK